MVGAAGEFVGWFAGGPDPYMTLVHCMNHDWVWIGITVALDLTIAAGYVMIARHWRRNELELPDSPAKRALSNMKAIFLFCGLCGYLFIPIKMFWPAWRLYDAFLLVLAYFTWRYALGARTLAVVYRQLRRTDQLAQDLAASLADSRRKSEFLSALSHDLRTPLNGIVLQAELADLVLETGDPAAVRESLAEIKACARASSDLLKTYLELGQIDATGATRRRDRFRLKDLIAAVLARFAVDPARVRLTVEVPENLRLATDEAKIEKILANLLENAVKYTEIGTIVVEASADGPDLSLTVTDTGPGVASEFQERIFEEFFQIHNPERDRRKGFGLGLPIARRLAWQLGGALTLQSRPGSGSCFSLQLPGVIVLDGREARTDANPAGPRPGEAVSAPG